MNTTDSRRSPATHKPKDHVDLSKTPKYASRPRSRISRDPDPGSPESTFRPGRAVTPKPMSRGPSEGVAMSTRFVRNTKLRARRGHADTRDRGLRARPRLGRVRGFRRSEIESRRDADFHRENRVRRGPDDVLRDMRFWRPTRRNTTSAGPRSESQRSRGGICIKDGLGDRGWGSALRAEVLHPRGRRDLDLFRHKHEFTRSPGAAPGIDNRGSRVRPRLGRSGGSGWKKSDLHGMTEFASFSPRNARFARERRDIDHVELVTSRHVVV